MNVLNKLTKKNLLLNKKRTIVTIIGIMLSTALVCAVAGLVTSSQQTFVNLIKNSDGDYHISFSNVPQEQQKILLKTMRLIVIILQKSWDTVNSRVFKMRINHIFMWFL